MSPGQGSPRGSVVPIRPSHDTPAGSHPSTQRHTPSTTMRHCPSCHATATEPENWCDHCGAHLTNDLGGKLAPDGRRAAAAAIDCAVVALWALAVWLVDSMGQSDFFDPPYSPEEHVLIMGTLAIILTHLWLTCTGRSIGKAAVGLRVVDLEGKVASIASLFLRETIGKFLSVTPGGLGFFVAFFDDHCQAFHDRIAKTYVVHHSDAERRRLGRRRGSPARRRRNEQAV